jgi:hypothetical protein
MIRVILLTMKSMPIPATMVCSTVQKETTLPQLRRSRKKLRPPYRQ